MAITVDSSNNPIVVTGTTGTSSAITTARIGISKIRWIGATTNAHKISLTDKAGKVKYKDQMATTNLTETLGDTFDPPLDCNGLYCDDMDSGELHIYVR